MSGHKAVTNSFVRFIAATPTTTSHIPRQPRRWICHSLPVKPLLQGLLGSTSACRPPDTQSLSIVAPFFSCLAKLVVYRGQNPLSFKWSLIYLQLPTMWSKSLAPLGSQQGQYCIPSCLCKSQRLVLIVLNRRSLVIQ